MGLINEYLRPLLQKLSLKSLHKRVEAIAELPVAAKNGDDFKGNMDQPDVAPKVSESKPLPPNEVGVTSETAKTLNGGGLKKASKKKGKELAAATPDARTSSGCLSRLTSIDNKGSNRGDGSGRDEVDDCAPWRKKILMGQRCKPLEVDGGGKNCELVEAAAEAASEVVNGVKCPAITVADPEERNRIVVSLERKCLDEDYPFPSREELDTDPYALVWLYIADICDYNTAATSSDGSATGGNSVSMRSGAPCESNSGKVLGWSKRRRSTRVMSRYLGKAKKTLLRKRRPRKAKRSATALFTSECLSEAVLCMVDGLIDGCSS